MPQLTSSAELRRLLERLAEAFAYGLVDAVAGATFDDVTRLVDSADGPGKASVSPPRASRPTQLSLPLVADSAGTDEPVRRRRTEAPPRADVLASIVAHLRTLPAGGRAEELRRDLGLDKPTFIRAINDGLATEEIRKTGRLRATTYFAE